MVTEGTNELSESDELREYELSGSNCIWMDAVEREIVVQIECYHGFIL